jgi:hypothetical protein
MHFREPLLVPIQSAPIPERAGNVGLPRTAAGWPAFRIRMIGTKEARDEDSMESVFPLTENQPRPVGARHD